MRRGALISLISLGAFVAFVALSAVTLFHTPTGRNLIKGQIESALEGELGGEMQIGALSGALPQHLILKDMIFSENGAPWLTVRRVELDWHPVFLFAKRIDIDRVSVEDVTLLASPPKSVEDTPAPSTFTLPDDLPHVQIRDLTVTNFMIDAAIMGSAFRVDGTSNLTMGGHALRAALNAKSKDGRDSIEAAVEISPENDHLYSDIIVASAKDGLIAKLIDSDGSVYFSAQADSPLSSGFVEISTEAGRYGHLEANISSNLKDVKFVDIETSVFPGEHFKDLTAELGPEVTLIARIEPKTEGGRLTITHFASKLGEVDGNVDWTSENRFPDMISLSFTTRFSSNYRPEIQKYLGPQVALRAILKRVRSDYTMDASLTGMLASASINDARTNFQDHLSGTLKASLEPNDMAHRALQGGASLTGLLNIDSSNLIALNSLDLQIAKGTGFKGQAVYDIAKDAFQMKGATSVDADFVTALNPDLLIDNPLFAQIDLSGPLNRLTLSADIDAPGMRISGQPIPAATIEVALAGLPSLPTGEITGHAIEGDNQFELTLRSTKTGHIGVQQFLFTGAGFALTGDGAYDPANTAVSLNLRYEGTENARPLPGLTATGVFSIEGTLVGASDTSDLSITAENLIVNDFSIDRLEATAKGPATGLMINASSDGLSFPNMPQIQDLSIAAAADLSGPLMIDLNAFEIHINNQKAELTAPAHITVDQEIGIENLNAQWGESGVIVFNGAISNTHWRATADVNRAPIPGAAGLLSFHFDLDTDREIPARGEFLAQSLLTQDRSVEINGAFSWDGERFHVKNADSVGGVHFDMTFPATLTKGEKLGVQIDGELDGVGSYKGDLTTIATYLPPDLQSLEGAVDASFALDGTISEPQISGKINIDDGAYTELRSGLNLIGLHAQAHTTKESDIINIIFTGGGRGVNQSGDDTLKLAGVLTLDDTPTIKADLTLDRVRVSARPVSSATASGSIRIEGPLDAITTTGDIIVNELNADIISPKDTGLVDIDVVNIHEGEPSVIFNAPTPPLTFDVEIQADDRVFVRGRGIESEWRVDVQLTGDAQDPVVIGELNLRRGWFDFSGRRFNLVSGKIVFDRLVANDPLITLRAEHQTVDGMTAIIAISGRTTSPTISLQSNPVLPTEDILAFMLFGKPAQELTALESLQAAQALAALSGVGPFGGKSATGSVRQALRLDLLNFDIDPERGGGALTVGKYVADKLFVSATQDAQGQNGSVRIQYEITNSIAVETEIKQDGDQTISANWKKDF